MKCKSIEKILTLYLDNMLKPGQRKKVEDHIKTCSKCRSLKEDFSRLLGLRGKLEQKPVSRELIAGIKNRLEESLPSAGFGPALKWGYVLVILLLIGTAGRHLIKRDKRLQDKVTRIADARHTEIPVTKGKNGPGIIEKREIKSGVIELAKLTSQLEDREVVFRGGAAAKNKIFQHEWKGITNIPEQDNFLVVGTEDEGRDLWKKHLKTSAPDIDFSKNIIIAAFSEGDDIQVTQIKETGSKYLVYFKETVAGHEGKTAADRSYHIVIIKK